MTEQTPFETWLTDNLPEGATFYRPGELPPDLRAKLAEDVSRALFDETDPDMLQAAQAFRARWGLQGH